MKKALAALAVSGALLLTGASAASATDSYAVPPPTCAASPASIPVGETTVITCDFDDSFEGNTVTFGIDGPAVRSTSLARIAFTARGSAAIDKVVAAGRASTTLTAPAAGAYTVRLTYGAVASMTVPIDVTVTDAGAVAGLPITGGTVPTEAIWIGVGALALGGIAVFAAHTRRGVAHT